MSDKSVFLLCLTAILCVAMIVNPAAVVGMIEPILGIAFLLAFILFVFS